MTSIACLFVGACYWNERVLTLPDLAQARSLSLSRDACSAALVSTPRYVNCTASETRARAGIRSLILEAAYPVFARFLRDLRRVFAGVIRV